MRVHAQKYLLTIACTAVCAALLWLLFVSSFQPQEMLLGAICAAATAAFIAFVARETAAHRQFRLRDVAEVWRVPLSIVADAGLVCKVLFRAIVLGHEPPSVYTGAPFAPGRGDPAGEAREALAVLYTTASPNAIAFGVQREEQCMILHQLEPAPVPRVVESLGAQRETQR